MYPDINTYPNIPYHALSSNHLIYDLVYNPEETIFIKKSKGKKLSCHKWTRNANKSSKYFLGDLAKIILLDISQFNSLLNIFTKN